MILVIKQMVAGFRALGLLSDVVLEET